MSKHKEYSKTFGIFYDNFRRWCREIAAYGFSTKMTESECVAELFKLYESWRLRENKKKVE